MRPLFLLPLAVALLAAAVACTLGIGPLSACEAQVKEDLDAYTQRVHALELGFRSIDPEDPGSPSAAPAVIRMISGDLRILDVKAVVQYRIKDLDAFLFRVNNPDGCPDGRTLRDVSMAVLSEVVGQRSMRGLTTPAGLQSDVEPLVTQKIQILLDHYRTGVEVLAVKFREVRPPPEVCDSLLNIRQALEHSAQLVALAWGGDTPSSWSSALVSRGISPQADASDPRRLMLIDIPPATMLDRRQYIYVFDAYVRYRIVDPQKFQETLKSEYIASSRIGQIVLSEIRAEVGVRDREDIIGGEPIRQLDGTVIVEPRMNSEGVRTREAIMRLIQERTSLHITEENDFGVEVVDVRLRAVDFTTAYEQATLQRMRLEPDVAMACEERAAF